MDPLSRVTPQTDSVRPTLKTEAIAAFWKKSQRMRRHQNQTQNLQITPPPPHPPTKQLIKQTVKSTTKHNASTVTLTPKQKQSSSCTGSSGFDTLEGTDPIVSTIRSPVEELCIKLQPVSLPYGPAALTRG